MSVKKKTVYLGHRLRQVFGRDGQCISDEKPSPTSDEMDVNSTSPSSPDALQTTLAGSPYSFPEYGSSLQTLISPSSESSNSTKSQPAVRYLKDTFVSRDIAELPSLEWLLAQFSGFAKEFAEVEDAKEEICNAARQLDDFIRALNEIKIRADFSIGLRARLEHINAYIHTQQMSFAKQILKMRRGSYLHRTRMAGQVRKDIVNIISHVHHDMLLLHFDFAALAHEDDAIRKALRPVSMAPIFASQDRGCMAGTRTAILDRLLTWAMDSTSPRIFWLSGMVGTGKTAVSQSFCDLLHANNVFAPSFFCSRRTLFKDHQDVTRVIPILATLLARKYPDFRGNLVAQLRSIGPDRDPLALTIAEQFRLLLQAPLSIERETPSEAVLIIDALDELQDQRLTGDFLDVLLSNAHSLPIKFFVTSRPEDRIRSILGRPHLRHHSIDLLRLHDVDKHVVQEDIRRYFIHNLASILPQDNEEPPHTQKSWPTGSQLNRLVQLAHDSFLYASTVVKYLVAEDPERRLQLLLAAQSTTAMEALDDTYRSILHTAFPPQGLEPQEKERRNCCLMTLINALRPLSILDMAELLDLETTDVRTAFKPLHSVVEVPTSSTGKLAILHTSFQEYLIDDLRSGQEQWHVSVPRTNKRLADCCLRIISRLRFNITESKSSHLANIDNDRGPRIRHALSYACQYGIEHLLRSHPLSTALVRYGICLRENFLYWLEVLSVIGMANELAGILMAFVAAIDAQDDFYQPDLRQFFLDAKEMVTRFQEPLSLSAPHIYISILPFAGPNSITQLFRSHFPRTLMVRDDPHLETQYPLLALRKPASGSNEPIHLLGGTTLYRVDEAPAIEVNSVAISPDSTHIISGSSDNRIRQWDVRSGTDVGLLFDGHRAEVYSVAFSPDSKRIASASRDHTIRIWDAETGKEVCEPIKGHTYDVTSVAFSSDSKRIVSGCFDRTIRIWDAQSGNEICEPFKGHTAFINSVSFSPDSTRIVSGSDDRTVRIWDVMTGKEECVASCADTVSSVSFSSDSTLIVSGCHDGTLRVLNAKSGEELYPPIEGHTDKVMSAMFSPDGTRVVSASWDRTCRVWDTQTGKEVCEPLESHTVPINSVAFSPDSKLIVAGCGGNTVLVWDALKLGKETKPFKNLNGHTDAVTYVSVSSDGSNIVSASIDDTIRVWDVYTGDKLYQSIENYNDSIPSLSALGGPKDKLVRFWNDKTRKEVGIRLQGHTDPISCIALSPDLTRIVSGAYSGDYRVRVWDSKTGEEVREALTGHTNVIKAVAFSPDSTRIVSGSWDKTIRVWDASTGELVCEPLQTDSMTVSAISVSPNSMRIAAGTSLLVQVWNAQTGDLLWKSDIRTGHWGDVRSVAFSPDSKYIVSGSADKTIRVWDAETGAHICEPLKGHTDWVNSAVFTPDSQSIVSGSSDHNIRVWDATMLGVAADAPPISARPVSSSSDSGAVTEVCDFRPSEHWESSGWVVSPSGERLFWVPVEFRTGFYWPTTKLVIGARPCRVDLSRFTHGEDWAKCYVGLEGEQDEK